MSSLRFGFGCFGSLCTQLHTYSFWWDVILSFLILVSLFEALSETKRLKEETDQKTRTRGEICSHILEKQRKISSMESDSVNIAQVFNKLLWKPWVCLVEAEVSTVICHTVVYLVLTLSKHVSFVVEFGAYSSRTRQFIC